MFVTWHLNRKSKQDVEKILINAFKTESVKDTMTTSVRGYFDDAQGKEFLKGLIGVVVDKKLDEKTKLEGLDKD